MSCCVSLSLSLCVSLCLSLAVSVSVSVSVSLSLSLSLAIYIHTYIYIYIYIYISADLAALLDGVSALENRLAQPHVLPRLRHHLPEEGRCKDTWKREFELPWREAGPPNHHDGKVDSDQHHLPE